MAGAVNEEPGMRTILLDSTARRLGMSIALLAGLAVLLVSLTPRVHSQLPPPAPHWYWGIDADAYAGAEIKVFDQDGNEVIIDAEGSGRVDSDGGWWVAVLQLQATQIRLRLITDSIARETDLLDVISGGFDPRGTSIADFKHVVTDSISSIGDSATISVRIIARRAEDGRIEFGMRGPDGVNILPPARFFPDGGPGHSLWLRSTEIDFGGGYVGWIIARYVEADGRTEFGFQVEGYEDIFPRARFFPADGPDHNRWLRSTEIEIGLPGR